MAKYREVIVLQITASACFRVRLDELRMFLENEAWELCPVKSNFNTLQLMVRLHPPFSLSLSLSSSRLPSTVVAVAALFIFVVAYLRFSQSDPCIQGNSGTRCTLSSNN